MTSSAIKRLGLLLVVVVAPLLHFAAPGAFWGRTSAAIAAGLMMIFFSREAIHDERVQDLKLKAINAAFSVSFTLTLVVNWFAESTMGRHPPCDMSTEAIAVIIH